MKLFNQLNATEKTAEENWEILNKLERHVTVRRIDAVVTQLVGIWRVEPKHNKKYTTGININTADAIIEGAVPRFRPLE